MKKVYSTQKQKEKAFLFGIIFRSDEDLEEQLSELQNLSSTAGLEVVGTDYQLIREINPATFIGSGKVENLKQKILEAQADVLVVNHELTGSQIKNLTNELNIKVIDRICLILDIFAQRATTNEGKLQVALAQAKYMLPRLSSISGTSGRFGSGGVGTRGPGETKLETDRRKLENNILILERQLKELEKQRSVKNKSRVFSNKTLVAIAGYTNAGKSTLLNLISKANIYADDKLFATLETTSRSVWLAPGYEIILTDTVGFISQLPHSLIHAFASTLDEVKIADIILHVVDVSNKHRDTQMEVVNKILADLAPNTPVITVYNKCDKIHVLPKMDEYSVLVSAKENRGIDQLKQKIMELIDKIKK